MIYTVKWLAIIRPVMVGTVYEAKRLANGSEVFSPLARNMNEYMNEVNIRYEYYDIL